MKTPALLLCLGLLAPCAQAAQPVTVDMYCDTSAAAVQNMAQQSADGFAQHLELAPRMSPPERGRMREVLEAAAAAVAAVSAFQNAVTALCGRS